MHPRLRFLYSRRKATRLQSPSSPSSPSSPALPFPGETN